MSFSTYDPYDAEWEHGDGARTVYVSSRDDDYCEFCDCFIDDCTCE